MLLCKNNNDQIFHCDLSNLFREIEKEEDCSHVGCENKDNNSNGTRDKIEKQWSGFKTFAGCRVDRVLVKFGSKLVYFFNFHT